MVSQQPVVAYSSGGIAVRWVKLGGVPPLEIIFNLLFDWQLFACRWF